MIALHQVRAVSLTGYVEVARFVGLDPYAMLARAGISPTMLDRPEMRLPATSVVELLEDSARESACDSFGLLMAECRTFESIGPITLLLQQLGSIRQIIEATIRYRRHINDILEIRVADESDTSLVEVALLPQFAGTQSCDLLVALTHLLLHTASRGGWKPTAVHFRHAAPVDRRIFDRFFPAPVQFNSTLDGFDHSRAGLDRFLPDANPAMAEHAVNLLNQVNLRPEKFPVADRVSRTIALLLPSGRANLESVASALDSGPRSLQRLLEAEGNNFGELLNKARRDLAQRHLSNHSQSISSVAELTGYSSSSSFTRWFAAEFGCSPTSWRRTAAA